MNFNDILELDLEWGNELLEFLFLIILFDSNVFV